MNAATPNSWLPQPLRKLAGRALETALNHTLSLDPDTQQRLAALNGRSVQLHLRGPEIALAVTVEDARLKVGPPQDDSQLRVAATPGVPSPGTTVATSAAKITAPMRNVTTAAYLPARRTGRLG